MAGFNNNYTGNQPIYQAMCIFPLFWCHFKDFRNGPASVVITQLINLSIKQCVFSLCSSVILRTLERTLASADGIIGKSNYTINQSI